MQGSIPRRTMIGGAKPVELEVEIDVDRPAADLRPLVLDAITAAPVSGLLGRELMNVFTLTVNGNDVPAAAPSSHMQRAPLPDPAHLLDDLAPADGLQEPLVVRDGMTPATDEVTSHAGSSYAPEQHRVLHLRGSCTVRPDGIKVIEQHLYNPHGSIFRLLSDEAPERGGGGRAPDAGAYISAGIGFCFMTQLGRFAKITGRRLDRYEIIQDTRFAAGHAYPVETHVYLDTPEDETFARDVLDMGERTCFLHALCRTAVATHVEVTTRRTSVTA